MVAQKQDTALIRDCKVECQKNHYSTVGTFQIQISPTFDIHELDQIEAEIEQVGQEFKRQLTRHVLEAADCRIAEVAQVANSDYHKHGTRPFTVVARYGDVTFERQRLHNPKKKKENTIIPSCPHVKSSRDSAGSPSHPLVKSSRRSAEPSSLRTTFFPVEVGEIPSMISHNESLMLCAESLMSHGKSKIEIVTPNGLTLRLPGETALDVLADLVRQLESASC